MAEIKMRTEQPKKSLEQTVSVRRNKILRKRTRVVLERGIPGVLISM